MVIHWLDMIIRLMLKSKLLENFQKIGIYFQKQVFARCVIAIILRLNQ